MFNANAIKQMQARLLKIQEDLANETVNGTAGGGAVTVTMTGKQEVRSVKIDPDAADPSDMSVLEDLVLVAVNDAIQKSQELAATRLSAVTGGMKIPGLM